MSTLSPSELRKYEWRIPTFLERLASGTFITTSNTEVKLTYYGEGLEEKLRTDSPRAIGKICFVDDAGNVYKLGDLLKDAAFGGVGSTLKREEQAIALFQQKLDIEKHNHGADAIPVVVSGTCYFVSSITSTPGTPKSDLHFLDPTGNEVVWISHKHGKSPRCFQQWGGCSERCEPNIYNHSETRDFSARIRGIKFFAGYTIARSIQDNHLKNLAVYGNEFGSDFGRNNVQLVVQGIPTFAANTANVHYDIVSHSVHANGDELPYEYAPTFMAMYRGDRNDFGITNCRVGISPRNARLITNWIDHGQSGPHSSHRGSNLHATCTANSESLERDSVCDAGNEHRKFEHNGEI